MGTNKDLDAHARPPEALRILFKSLQKDSLVNIAKCDKILDFEKPGSFEAHAQRSHYDVDCTELAVGIASFLNESPSEASCSEVYEVNATPGAVHPSMRILQTPDIRLFIYPKLLSNEVQLALLDKLLHRDLSDPQHLTNIHLFHEMEYANKCKDPSKEVPDANESFFATEVNAVLQPKDPAVHRSMTIAQMLRRKLRWITLGGQYDWTAKAYPSEPPPAFPQDIAGLLKGFFPTVEAQAAIVNLYTPGDTLSIHRDVSEACDRDLISISIGCDALFLVGNEDGSRTATIRLHSGDAVLMSGPSRYAWHAVPRVIAETCPVALADWPGTSPDPRFRQWAGWLQTKRINLNVRQMNDT